MVQSKEEEEEELAIYGSKVKPQVKDRKGKGRALVSDAKV